MTKNKHAQALGKLGGKANTEAQRIARSLNGKKGGRKKKITVSYDARIVSLESIKFEIK